MDELLALLIANRGEEGCDIAVKKIKKNFKVDKLSELSTYQLSVVVGKERKRVKKENSRPCKCGKTAYRRGLFYICNSCKAILDDIEKT